MKRDRTSFDNGLAGEPADQDICDLAEKTETPLDHLINQGSQVQILSPLPPETPPSQRFI